MPLRKSAPELIPELTPAIRIKFRFNNDSIWQYDLMLKVVVGLLTDFGPVTIFVSCIYYPVCLTIGSNEWIFTSFHNSWWFLGRNIFQWTSFWEDVTVVQFITVEKQFTQNVLILILCFTVIHITLIGLTL